MVDVVHQRGSAAALHGLDPFARAGDESGREPRVWWCDLTRSAVVLGSRQHDDVLDLDECRRRQLQVVRRRSGGGVVLMEPDAIVWIDVVLPHGVAPDDVRGSMVWIGERWVTALGALGVGDLEVHDGGMVGSAWSDLVCFAGLGPGEVLRRGDKLVGLSQRRTRHGLRVQGLVHVQPLMDATVSVLRMPHPDGTPPQPAWIPGLDPAALAAALADAVSHAAGPS